jgi:hypothetical protein
MINMSLHVLDESMEGQDSWKSNDYRLYFKTLLLA